MNMVAKVNKANKYVFPALIAGITLMASGCSGSGGEQGNNSGGATAEGGGQPAKRTEPVELVIHTNNGATPESFDANYGDRIRQKFPDYKITYIQSKAGSTLQDLLATGQRVDILFQTDSYYFELAQGSKLEFDMTDLAKKHGVDLNAIEPRLIEGLKASGGGKLYALPVSNMIQVMYYNKSIFDKFGVPYPKDGMNWDEVHELSKKLDREDGGVSYIGFTASPAHILGNNQYSIPYVDAKTDKPTFLDSTWNKLFETYLLTPGKTEGYQKFVTGKKKLPYRLEFTDTPTLGMFVFNSSFPFLIPNINDINWDLVALPVFKEKPKVGSQSMPVVFGMTSMAKDKDAAMEVIKYLASEEAQLSEAKKGNMPVLTSAAVRKAFAQDTPFKDKNWGALYYNEIAPGVTKNPFLLSVEKVLTPYVQQVIEGKKDLNTALREAQEHAEKTIADAKLKNK
jgi:multiple sugar transport system substrate-binding protein